MMRLVGGCFLMCILVACSQSNQVYTPVSGLSKEEMDTSKNRAKQLNTIERQQIEDWIKQQKTAFYPTSLNYWVDKPNFEQRTKKNNGEKVSYQYEIFDFNKEPFYSEPKIQKEIVLGKFQDLEAVENAVRFANEEEEITLLVPSVLAYGTYGDGDQIPHDMPLIIKLKRLK